MIDAEVEDMCFDAAYFICFSQNNNNHHRTRPQTEYFPSEIDNCDDDFTMGNGCSFGNFRRRRHNAIAPRHPTKLHEISIGEATTKSQFLLAPKPRRLSTTRSEFPKRIGSPKSVDGVIHVRAAAAAVIAPVVVAAPVPVTDTHNRHSLIDENSILSDANDTPKCSVLRVKPSQFVRCTSIDSATTDAIIRHDSIDDGQVKNENRNLSKLYRQISGSVQSLFQTNLNLSKKHQLSASDTSLNVCGVKPKNNRLLLSQQQLVDSNYCPSVLYSRKSRNATSELNLGKTQTFNRWKNHLWLRVTRRKSDTNIRPSKT